jgi:hypothetical protein
MFRISFIFGRKHLFSAQNCVPKSENLDLAVIGPECHPSILNNLAGVEASLVFGQGTIQ